MDFTRMTTAEVRSAQRYLKQANALLPDVMTKVPEEQWRHIPANPMPLETWRSCQFVAQVYAEPNGIERISVNRSEIDEARRCWAEGITWEDLMIIKHELGRGDKCAVEVLPPSNDVVNVASLRHIWVLPEVPAYVWRKQ